MLNFAEQTGSGAVMLIWSFLSMSDVLFYINIFDYARFCGGGGFVGASGAHLDRAAGLDGVASSHGRRKRESRTREYSDF